MVRRLDNIYFTGWHSYIIFLCSFSFFFHVPFFSLQKNGGNDVHKIKTELLLFFCRLKKYCCLKKGERRKRPKEHRDAVRRERKETALDEHPPFFSFLKFPSAGSSSRRNNEIDSQASKKKEQQKKEAVSKGKNGTREHHHSKSTSLLQPFPFSIPFQLKTPPTNDWHERERVCCVFFFLFGGVRSEALPTPKKKMELRESNIYFFLKKQTNKQH